MTEINSVDSSDFSTINADFFDLEIPSHKEEYAPTSSFTSAFSTLQVKSSIQERMDHAIAFVARHSENNLSVRTALYHLLQSWNTLENLDDVEKLLTALEFSAQYHSGQYRDGEDKIPYIIHPIGVCILVWESGTGATTDMLIAALLHDTLEDTDATAEEIENLFGPHVLRLVLDLTTDPKLSSKEAKQHQLDHAPYMHEQAKVVKLCDRLYNITDLLNSPPPTWSQEGKDAYIAHTEKLVKALEGAAPFIENEIANIVAAYKSLQK